jgi:hypothetical protein
MALRTPEKPDEYNPVYDPSQDEFQNIIDQNFSSGDQKMMQQRAEDGAASDIQNNSNSTAEDLLNDESSAVQKNNSRGIKHNEKDSGWQNNTSARSNKKNIVQKFQGAKKKYTIAIAVIGVSFTVLGFILSFLVGAMGIVQMKENLVSRMSQRAADAMERRKTQIMAKKFSQDVTRGLCTSGIQLKCRYRGFSDREIKKFNKRAERAGLGYRIAPDGRSGLTKSKVVIEKFDLKNPDKVLDRISPENYKNEIRKNSDFRKAFNSFYKGNIEYHAGRVGSFTLAKYKVFRGKIKATTGQGDTDEKRRKYSLRDMVRKAVSGQTGSLESSRIAMNPGDPPPIDPADDSNIINEDVKNEIEKDVEKEKAILDDPNISGDLPPAGSDAEKSRFRSITDSIKNRGGGIGGFVGNPLAAMQGMCMVRMIANAAASGRSVIQSAQLIKFSAQFTVLADQIKANEADEDTLKSVGLLMGMLSEKDERGYTAFDSAGYNWVMSQNNSVRGTPNEDIGRFQNGGTAPGRLGSVVTTVTSDNTLKGLCGVAMSKTVTIISIGLTFTGIGGLFKSGVSKGIAETFEALLKREMRKKIDNIIDKDVANTALKRTLKLTAGMEAADIIYNLALPRIIGSLSKMIAGTTVTGDEVGPDAGNALVSGFGATVSQTSKAQGMMPLNPDRAVATDRFAYENQLKLAKEDGINQFDVNNRFSFANQLAVAILPTQLKFSSFSSLPFALSNMASSSLSLPFTKTISAAGDPKKQYEFCSKADEVYEEKNIATDPMCNPIYGLPAAVKDIDPEEVLDYLIGEGLLDENGEPKGEFSEFIEQCMQSQTPYGEEDICLKGGGLEEKANFLSEDDKKYAMMRLYCLDTSVDVDMNDGEGVGCAPKVQNQSATGEVDAIGELPSGEAKELAQQIIGSGKVSGDDRYMSQIRNIANGDNSCPVSENILGLILGLSKKYKLHISSLNRKCTGVLTASGEGSLHYEDGGGRAVDIDVVDDVSMTYSGSALDKARDVFNDAAQILPKNAELGQINSCGVTGVDTNGITDIVPDSCNHIHIGIPD